MPVHLFTGKPRLCILYICQTVIFITTLTKVLLHASRLLFIGKPYGTALSTAVAASPFH